MQEYISPDEVNWTILDNKEMNKVTSIMYSYNNISFVAVGNEGTLITLQSKTGKVCDRDYN